MPTKPKKGFSDPVPKYWDDYSTLQAVKHALIRRYLGGYFPKLGSFATRVLYFDTHAGRGKHLSGELGSPLVALQTLLNHGYRDELLKKTEFRFILIERDAANHAALQAELDALTIPPKVIVTPVNGDGFAALADLVAWMETNVRKMAPAFVFVDPYGFTLPGELLRRLFNVGKTELFINVIWRELDMAITHARSGHAGFIKALDSIFDGDRWRKIDAPTSDERADQATQVYAEMVGAKWATRIRMLGDNGATRYVLLHLSNHDAGRELMKDCIWSVCPDGGFYAHKSADQAQPLLIEPEPDFAPLEKWVRAKLAGGPQRWSALTTDLLPELWRGKHLNDVIRKFRNAGVIVASGYEGKFSEKADPLLALADEPK